LPNVIAIVAFKISLSKKVGHSLKRTCDISDIAIKEFICAEERGCYEVFVPQAGISRDVGTIWDYHGRGEVH